MTRPLLGVGGMLLAFDKKDFSDQVVSCAAN